MIFHNSALLQEALQFLAVQPGRRYIDCTLGGGGHTREIIKRGGQVLGLDQDLQALEACPELVGLTKVQTNFVHLKEIAQKHGWLQVSGVLFDLGVSLHQLTAPNRGFSHKSRGPLDMRMDLSLPNTAATLANNLPHFQLSQIFRDYGQIPTAKSLAQKIIAARPLSTTIELAKLTGKWSQQAFMALRIAVNDELNALETTLPQAYELLEPGGRLVVISFHSLEDRLVKRYFQKLALAGRGQIGTQRPVIALPSEIQANPRSRSAKLRCFIKY